MQSSESMQQLRAIQEEGGLCLRRGTTARTNSTTFHPTGSAPHTYTVHPNTKWRCSCHIDGLCHFNLSGFLGERCRRAHIAGDRYYPGSFFQRRLDAKQDQTPGATAVQGHTKTCEDRAGGDSSLGFRDDIFKVCRHVSCARQQH